MKFYRRVGEADAVGKRVSRAQVAEGEAAVAHVHLPQQVGGGKAARESQLAPAGAAQVPKQVAQKRLGQHNGRIVERARQVELIGGVLRRDIAQHGQYRLAAAGHVHVHAQFISCVVPVAPAGHLPNQRTIVSQRVHPHGAADGQRAIHAAHGTLSVHAARQALPGESSERSQLKVLHLELERRPAGIGRNKALRAHKLNAVAEGQIFNIELAPVFGNGNRVVFSNSPVLVQQVHVRFAKDDLHRPRQKAQRTVDGGPVGGARLGQ